MRSFLAAGFILMLTLCPAGGPDPQDVYQAKEQDKITVTCLYPLKNNKSADFFQIHIVCMNSGEVIYTLDSKTHLYPDELYRGRVWCDPELARTGPIKCVFTDLRLTDTGTYRVFVHVNEDIHHKSFHLNVTGTTTM